MNNSEVREALFRVFDGWAEQKAAMQEQKAAMQEQAVVHIKQLQAYEASFEGLTAQHESLRNLVKALDTEDE